VATLAVATMRPLTWQQERPNDMSKMNALSQATPNVPAEYIEEQEHFKTALARHARPSLFGRLLRFKKGKWVYGDAKDELPEGTQLVAIMAEARIGWIKWARDADGKATPTHIVGRIVDGFEVPDRDTLDCHDQSEWKVGLSGKPEDPWRRVCYLPLVSPDGEQLLTFSTSTNTGINSFWRLVDNYHWLSRRHPGQFPVVEIFTDGYDDKRWGWIDTPGFKIVAWHGRPDLQQLTGGEQTTDEPSLKDDMEGDEIPW
jgi:hypothetical protein